MFSVAKNSFLLMRGIMTTSVVVVKDLGVLEFWVDARDLFS